MDRKYIKYLILPCFLGSLSSIVSIYFGFIIQSFMKAAINGSIYKSSIYHAFLWLLCVSILGVGYECVKALFLQKIRCPRCNNLMGGKATKKKNGNVYYYYYCNDVNLI